MVPKDFVDEVISSLFEDAVDPKISVVGVGGAGGKMVSALYDRGIKGVETIAVNTDPSGLSKAECDVKILLAHREDRTVSPRRARPPRTRKAPFGPLSRRISCSSSRASAVPPGPGRPPSSPVRRARMAP